MSCRPSSPRPNKPSFRSGLTEGAARTGLALVGFMRGVRRCEGDDAWVVTLVLARGGTLFPGDTKPRPSRDSIQSLVAIKRDGEWR